MSEANYSYRKIRITERVAISLDLKPCVILGLVQVDSSFTGKRGNPFVPSSFEIDLISLWYFAIFEYI